jgi:hypothetical protein
MTLSVTEIDPCLPTAPRRGFMFCHFPSGYPKGFDLPKDKQSLSKCVSQLFLSLLNPLLENRHLHFELVDLIFQKEDFLVFGVGVHGSKAFEASLTNSS